MARTAIITCRICLGRGQTWKNAVWRSTCSVCLGTGRMRARRTRRGFHVIGTDLPSRTKRAGNV